MRAIALLAVALAWAGCAATPPEAAGSVVVDVAERDASPPAPPTPLPAEPDERDPELRSLAACAAALRRAPDAPLGPVRDRYLFALDAEDNGELLAAREAYLWVAEEAGDDSIYAPLAFLGLSEMYDSGGQLGLARRLLTQAATLPVNQNPVHLYARYRRGMVDQRLGDHDRAMFELVHVVKGAQAHREQACSALLAVAARRALVASYIEAGAPDRAHHFFAPLSGDLGEGFAHTVDVLLELARGYLAADKAKDAAIVLAVILARYAPLRPQCVDIGTLVERVHLLRPDGAAVDALAERLAERCGGARR